jgi:uncharacterized protein DUF3558
MRRTTIGAAAGLAVLALTATGCKSGTHAATTPTTPTTPTTSTTAAASDGTAGSASTVPSTAASAPAIVVCTVLPTSQVASLSGVALATSREQDAAEGNSYTCDYFPASGSGGLSVTVQTVDGAQAYANSLQTDTIAGAAEHVAPLTGVGDKAFSARDGVRALFGDRMIYVAGLASNPPAVAIIQALQAKLG